VQKVKPSIKLLDTTSGAGWHKQSTQTMMLLGAMPRLISNNASSCASKVRCLREETAVSVRSTFAVMHEQGRLLPEVLRNTRNPRYVGNVSS
jgi:hypothetical protein